MIRSMSKEAFLNKNPIYVEHIEEGFTTYPALVLHGSKASLKMFIFGLLKENLEDSYADFYYATLTEEKKQQFIAGLNERERECLATFEVLKEQVFYPLTLDNLEFLADITAREWMFSTFYFVKHKVTVWGNYDRKYPLFAEDEEALKWCKNMAEKCDILIESVEQK